MDCTLAYMFLCIQKYNGLHIGVHVFLYTKVQWIAHWHTCFSIYKSTMDCTLAYMFFYIQLLALVYTLFQVCRKAKEKAGKKLPADGMQSCRFRRPRLLCESLKALHLDIPTYRRYIHDCANTNLLRRNNRRCATCPICSSV